MGLDSATVTFLCASRSLGVDFSRTVTIGRQSFWPDLGPFRRAFAVLGVPLDPADYLAAHDRQPADPFFQLLGAQTVDSVDVSDYQGASHLHDLNLPLPDNLQQGYTAVVDVGTLEHVFNVPQAYKNCLAMVVRGGHFLQISPANNWMGHGFWQFSPELIYRVCSPQNGYHVRVVLLHEVVPRGRWFVAADPDQIRRRAELCNPKRTYMLTIAQCVEVIELFTTLPQQTDYAQWWAGNPTPRPAHRPLGRVRRLTTNRVYQHTMGLLPAGAVRLMRQVRRALVRFKGFSADGYRRVTESDLLRGRLPTTSPS